MDILNQLAAKAMSGIEAEAEGLAIFMRSFCRDMEQAGEEIPERDRPAAEAFKMVSEAADAVEEKTKELEAKEALDTNDIADATRRLGELRFSVDKLQTNVLRNPPLVPFAKRVAQRASELSERLVELTQIEFQGDIDDTYNQFKLEQ